MEAPRPWPSTRWEASCLASAPPLIAAGVLVRGGEPDLWVVSMMALAAAAASALGTAPSPPARLAAVFPVAAWILWPAPWGTAIASVAAVVGAGGMAGPRSARPSDRLAAAAGAVLAGVAAAAIPREPAGTVAAAARSGVALAVLHAGAWGFALLVGRTPRSVAIERGRRNRWSAGLADAATLPLGWALAWTIAADELLVAGVVGAGVLGGTVALRRLAAARADLRLAEDALAARAAELAAFHALGLELVSSFDPARVYAAVERECSKILPLDAFLVALVDREAGLLRIVHRRPRRSEDGEEIALDQAFGSWSASGRLGVRVDDFRRGESALPFGAACVAPEMRSVLAAPLILDQKVTGFLSIQSRRPSCYGEHQLTLLATIAQHAAIALENARRHDDSTLDSLTHLLRRDYFHRRVEDEYRRACRYRSPFALLAIDLDAFREINEKHGHFGGDWYLRGFAATLRNLLRASDLACRHGGDEFCLLLTETTPDRAAVIAERIRASVSRLAVEGDGAMLRTTVSIGIAAFPEHDTGDLRSLFRKADQALFRAKRDGRDRVVSFSG